MELWVRSQDKEFLAKVKGLFYWQQNLTNPDTTLHKISSGETTLGKYQTKERCIEILNNIVELMSTKTTEKTLIIQMPEK